jgi:formylglycine-generating enzyme required for sulfatase activity
MADVFFSHKREDRTRIVPLVRLLEGEGLTVWWDSSLAAGERFDQVISREIAEARCVIVAWSASSINSMWVRDEATTGRDRDILVPLSLDGARSPLGFGGFQTPDLSDWSGDADDPRVRQLITGVRRVVSGVGGGVSRDAPSPLRPPVVVPPLRMARRRLLQIGAAAGAVGITSAAGLWLAMPRLSRGSVPPTRIEEFDVVTVDAGGKKNPPLRRSVAVFDVLIGGATLEFTIIPAGKFQIGSPDDEPQRRPNEGPQRLINLPKFAIGRTAVTQAQWGALVGVAPDTLMRQLSQNPSYFRGDDLPVETVSWDDATEFCERLSKVTGLRIRLPTEAEWEYACRAYTTSAFHFGPTVTPELANYCGTGGAVRGMNEGADVTNRMYGGVSYDSGSYANGPVGVFNDTTMKVRTYPPNRFGLFEMHGNVWEHCLDAGPVSYSQVAADGTPFSRSGENHVLRGGAWSHNPAICRSAYREGMASNYVGWQGRVGLRVVCELGEQADGQS